MCGLVAIVSFEHAVSLESLRAATAALGHRGTDGTVTWLSPDGHVGLGHTRLSINDLTARHPIANEVGDHRLIANGEFYEFDAIRGELESRGHRFRTRTDSEIALHLYEERGERCLDRLRGEFAFIVWDAREQTLFAARDRFGIKPLYFAQHKRVLYVASEAKALFKAGVPAVWDDEAVFRALHGCYVPDHSLFCGVRQLPPGHYLTASRAGIKIERYWDIEYPADAAVLDERECVEEVRRLLDESVGIRMRADVPVGYLLSGGLDSSTMLGLAAARHNGATRAFTVAFSSDRYDESVAARHAAAHAGAELDVLRVTDADFAEHFADSVCHGEGIQYNAHGTARYLLSREIRRSGYRSVMGGEGADELFAGYGFVRSALKEPRRRRLRMLRLLRPLNASERVFANTSPLVARASRIVELPDWATERALQWFETLRSVLKPEFVSRFAGHDPFAALVDSLQLRRNLPGGEGAKKILYVWLRSIFPNYHLAADRIDMAHALEVRLPYLDHELFAYVSRIPVSTLAKNGQQKYLLREAARPYVTDAVYRGDKRPFIAPPSAVQVGSRLFELMQETFRSSAMATVPFFDQKAALALVDGLDKLERRRRETVDPILTMMASVAILHDRYRL